MHPLRFGLLRWLNWLQLVHCLHDKQVRERYGQHGVLFLPDGLGYSVHGLNRAVKLCAEADLLHRRERPVSTGAVPCRLELSRCWLCGDSQRERHWHHRVPGWDAVLGWFCDVHRVRPWKLQRCWRRVHAVSVRL